MKNTVKILLPLIFVAGLWGCNLDRFPKDAIEQTQALLSIKDIQAVRAGNYAITSGFFGPGAVVPYEVMGDYMNSAMTASNTYGPFIRWQFMVNQGEISGVWGAGYSAIANINFLLDNIGNVAPQTAEQEAYIKQTIAEVRILRAMVEHRLLLIFCKSYNQVADPTTEYGIPMMRNYDGSAKPARRSLYDSYQMILEDIEFAKTELANIAGSPNAYYINIDCVHALEAQVLLQMGGEHYADAALAAKKVIDNPAYSLVSDPDDFKNMWIDDQGQELIFTFYATLAEGGASIWGNMFMEDPRNDMAYFTAEFIPTQDLLDMYQAGDIRKDAYFTLAPLRITGIDYNTWMLNKYPGNPELYAGDNNHPHKNKVLRLADMYLIAAEAYAMASMPEEANTMLNTLRGSRIAGYTDVSLSGTDLMQAIKDERLKEMVMEGTRIPDLKRWGDGVSRMAPQTAPGNVTLEDTRVLNKPAGDYMFVWPIPRSEMNANPNIARQQNEGWGL